MKRCSKCKIEKELSEFCKNKSAADGLNYRCRQCLKTIDEKWRAVPENKEKHRGNQRRWRSENKERDRENYISWTSIPRNADRTRDLKRKYFNAMYKNNLMFKLRKNLSNRLNKSLKSKSWHKNSSTKDIIGCTLEELLQHLGPSPTYEHHIDHICPCAQAQTEEELYKLFHYSNLRYFPASDNRSKNDSWTEEGEQLCLELLGRPWVISTEFILDEVIHESL